MAKKKAKKSGVLEGIGGAITDLLLGGIFPRIKSEADELMTQVERRALVLQERIMRKIGVSLINGLGVVFLLFSLFYYLIEFQGMMRTHVFLYLGLALLVVAFYLKYQMLKQETR